MKIGKIALISGAMLATLGAMTVAACSSSSTGNPSTGADSGTPASGDSGTTPGADSGTPTGDSGTPTGDSGSPGTDSGTACKDPGLHPETGDGGTIYCGFPADGGPAFSCTTGQQCCLGGTISTGVYAPETCATWGGTCDNPSPDKGTHIECNQVIDCAANGKPGAACCLQGVSGGPALVPGCSSIDYKQQGGTAVKCELPAAGDGGTDAGAGGGVPACASGETQICATQADCPTGTTCTAMHWKLYNVGFCK